MVRQRGRTRPRWKQLDCCRRHECMSQLIHWCKTPYFALVATMSSLDRKLSKLTGWHGRCDCSGRVGSVSFYRSPTLIFHRENLLRVAKRQSSPLPDFQKGKSSYGFLVPNGYHDGKVLETSGVIRGMVCPQRELMAFGKV